MKKIYLVLTHTGTMLSRIIKVYTKNEFSHSSISLDDKLMKMYSFGRLNPNNPFIGGFVHEYIDKGTFKRFKNTTTKVYELNISDEQYDKIQEIINKLETHKSEYKFNVLGLFLVALKFRYKREKSFYCAEFVKYVLEHSNLNLNLPNIPKPDDFRNLDGMLEIYTGKLNQYNM